MNPNPGIEAVIVPSTHELGDGFQVRRALPSRQRHMVGPFVFFDQMGPTVLGAGTGLDERPHPHIGLATVTHLFDGEIIHRDSLGTVQPIRPGEGSWMIAGRGIVHSERTAADKRRAASSLCGMQTWAALPKTQEQRAPGFQHHAVSELPRIDGEGTSLRLITRSLYRCTRAGRHAVRDALCGCRIGSQRAATGRDRLRAARDPHRPRPYRC